LVAMRGVRDPSWMPPGSFPKHLAVTPPQDLAVTVAAPSSLPKCPAATPAAVTGLLGPQEQGVGFLQHAFLRGALQASTLASRQLKRLQDKKRKREEEEDEEEERKEKEKPLLEKEDEELACGTFSLSAGEWQKVQEELRMEEEAEISEGHFEAGDFPLPSQQPAAAAPRFPFPFDVQLKH